MNKNNSRQVFKKAQKLLNLSQHAELLTKYLDGIMKDERRDPVSVEFFIKYGGLSNVYDNIVNIKDDLEEIADELTDISDELEGGSSDELEGGSSDE